MYARNSATPNQLAIGPVVQISDGAVQTSGCTVRILPFGGAEGDGAGTTAYSTDGVVLYTPSQAETNYTSFVLIAKKTGCIPASITIVTSASATPGTALLAPVTHTSAVVPTVTTVSNAVSVNTGTTTAVVSHDGNNATSGATLKSVAEAATAGSTLLVGPGTYALGNAVINANITMIGAGNNRTVITSTAITGDFGAILNVAEVRHLRVTPVGTAVDGQIAWGVRELSSQTVWSRYRAVDCWFDGDLDAVFFQMEFATTAAELERCRCHAKYDAVRWGVESSASTLYVRDCDLEAIGPAAAGTLSRGVASTGGTVYVTGGRIHASGSAVSNSAIYNTAAMHLAGVTLTSAGTAAKDIETAIAGVTSVAACAYDASKTSGALTPTYAQGNWNTTTPPTVQQNATAAAAAILATPVNKLVTNGTGQVEASNAAGLTAEQAAQLAAAANQSVAITPLQASVSNPIYATRDLQAILQGAAPVWVWTITDGTGAAVDLSAKTVRFVACSINEDDEDSVYDDGLTALFQYETGGSGIAISGAGSNIVTVTSTYSDMATLAGVYRYFLWNVTDRQTLATGKLPIKPAKIST
jgi:hypothetical protein